jgi:hypothetical protein
MNNFDWIYYLENNLDLKKKGINTKEEAIIHWCDYGKIEDRPHKFLKNETEHFIMNIQNLLSQNIITKEESWDILINIINEKENAQYGYFDWEYYLIENEELFKFVLTTKDEALEHWNTIGKYDNNFKYSKDYITLEKITKDNFDWIYYIKNNIDLIKNNILTLDKSWDHWINYGKYENRKYKCKFDQNITYETFDWEYYLEKNLDLKNLTQEGAWQHWMYYGRNEDREIRLYSKKELENNSIILNDNNKIIYNLSNKLIDLLNNFKENKENTENEDKIREELELNKHSIEYYLEIFNKNKNKKYIKNK